MNFTRLRYFCDVARLQSFSKAADENYISQTAISQQIAKLEDELQVSLIDRTKLPIELTRIGKTVYQRSKIILEQYDVLKGEIAQMKQTDKVVTVAYPNGAVEPVEELVLPKIKAIDGLELFLVKSDLNDIQDKLLNKTVDLAVTFDSEITATNQLSTIVLANGNYDVVVGKDHPWYQVDTIEPAQLINERVIYVENRPNTNSYLKMKDHSQADNVPLNITATVADIDTALLLVQLNKGITFIPDYKSLKHEYSSLHRVKILNSQHKYKICLAWRTRDGNENLRKIIDQFDR
ncbi:LysR family transcriptional regulator [Companilactobacillus hulinensis]|uniref:LysR family transcriptional regulator n=1 Tax=Companilactobacillus hulinensis TaxID=2486007 RepID=UPI000F7810E1|nr:LysR family transcriptional regulator [Companilactobacillus hulinensis]